MKQSHITLARTHGTALGRILMGVLFFYSGAGILMGGVGMTAGFYDSLGIPMAALMAWVVVALKLGAGGALILGYRARDAALTLFVFTAIVTVVGHFGDGFGADNMNLWKNLAIMGGLLYVMAYGAGEGWKIKG